MTSTSMWTDSAPRSDRSSSIVVAPTMAVETTGFRKQPGERHVRWLRVQVSAQPFVRFELVAVGVDAVLGLACDASLAGGVENAREQASVERAVRDQPDAEVTERGDQLQFDGPNGEVVQALLDVRPKKCRADAADWARATSQAAKLLLPT